MGLPPAPHVRPAAPRLSGAVAMRPSLARFLGGGSGEQRQAGVPGAVSGPRRETARRLRRFTAALLPSASLGAAEAAERTPSGVSKARAAVIWETEGLAPLPKRVMSRVGGQDTKWFAAANDYVLGGESCC